MLFDLQRELRRTAPLKLLIRSSELSQRKWLPHTLTDGLAGLRRAARSVILADRKRTLDYIVDRVFSRGCRRDQARKLVIRPTLMSYSNIARTWIRHVPASNTSGLR